MTGFRNLLVTLFVYLRCRSLIGCFSGGFAVEHPERNINAMDLFDMVVVLKGFRQIRSSLIVHFQFFDRFFFADLKRDHIIRLQYTGKLSGHNSRIPAVGTGGCRSRLIADQLRAAGRTIVAFHACCILAPVVVDIRSIPALFGRLCLLLLFPFRLFFCLFLGFDRFFFLLGIHRFDFCDFILRTAVITFQLAKAFRIMQRSGTGRTLIIGNLFRHNSSSPLRIVIIPVSLWISSVHLLHQRGLRTPGRISADWWDPPEPSRTCCIYTVLLQPVWAFRIRNRICLC